MGKHLLFGRRAVLLWWFAFLHASAVACAAIRLDRGHNEAVTQAQDETEQDYLVSLQLGFPTLQVQRFLEREELETFVRLTEGYLEARHVALAAQNGLAVTGQHWHAYKQLAHQEKEETKSSSEGSSDVQNVGTILVHEEPSAAAKASRASSLPPTSQVWTVMITVHAIAATTDIPSLFLEDGSSYIEILLFGLHQVLAGSGAAANAMTDQTSEPASTQQDGIMGAGWMLATLALSISLLFAVVILRCSHRRHQHNEKSTRLGHVNSPKKSSSVSPPPPQPFLFWHQQWRHERMDDNKAKTAGNSVCAQPHRSEVEGDHLSVIVPTALSFSTAGAVEECRSSDVSSPLGLPALNGESASKARVSCAGGSIGPYHHHTQGADGSLKGSISSRDDGTSDSTTSTIWTTVEGEAQNTLVSI